MRDNKLHTPDGVKDILPGEYACKKETEKRILDLFARYGFLPLQSPMFEYMEVFEDSLSNRGKMYKFLDRDGSILALRPDMTPPIARMAATVLNPADLPFRLCYFENAFQYNESYQGKLKEFTQAGAELIGVKSVDADAEVVALAIQSLFAAGLKDFRVDIGQVEFLNGVLEESGLDPGTRTRLLQYIADRDYVSAEKLASLAGDNLGALIAELPLLIGGEEVAERAERLTESKRARAALATLRDIYRILSAYGVEESVNFDLSMIGHLDYYTGIIFRGYAPGTGQSVLDGGRYDNLVARFGRDYPAVGFAVKVNVLLAALRNGGGEYVMEKPQSLIAYTEKGREAAIRAGRDLRQRGVSIENSLLVGNFQENKDFAQKRGMGGVLYFEDENSIIVADLLSGTENRVTVGELLER